MTWQCDIFDIVMWNFHIAMSYFSLNKWYTSLKRFTCACQNAQCYVKISHCYVKISHSYVKEMTLLCESIHMTMAKYSIRSFIKTKNVCENITYLFRTVPLAM